MSINEDWVVCRASYFLTNKSCTKARIISRQVGQNRGRMLDWNSFLMENSWSSDIISRSAGNSLQFLKKWPHIIEK